jgi:hypothetical protein
LLVGFAFAFSLKKSERSETFSLTEQSEENFLYYYIYLFVNIFDRGVEV